MTPPLSAESGESGDDVTWSLERDVLRRTTRCVVDHGSTYPVPNGGTACEHYRGEVTVADSDFRQTAHAETEFSISWPDVTVTTVTTLDFTATHDSYEICIELEAREGDELVGRRKWRERISRDLA